MIETISQYCENCEALRARLRYRKTKQDRWTGEIQSANSAANIPDTIAKRILEVYNYTDIIEQRKRAVHKLVIDHRFPMERWGESEPPHLSSMSENEIKKKFQLLKKDTSGNHNLLKSRSCEHCIKTDNRSTPFNINFWYEGGEKWSSSHKKGAEAEAGCVGCGWYDFAAWRNALNRKLASPHND